MRITFSTVVAVLIAFFNDKVMPVDKISLRRLYKQKREQFVRDLSFLEREICHKKISNHIEGLLKDQTKIIGAYWPRDDECDIRPLLKRLETLGFTLALPHFLQISQKIPLHFHRWNSSLSLIQNQYGIWQPSAQEPLCEPDILLVPLLAFDPQGYRLGLGSGLYDMTIRVLKHHKKVLTIGVAFEVQKISILPFDRHDEKLDYVVTELGIYQYQ